MITDPSDEQVMVFVFFEDDEECHPDDSLCTFVSPVKTAVETAVTWSERFSKPLGDLLCEACPVVRGGDLYHLFIEGGIQPGREFDGIVDDLKSAFGRSWKNTKMRVRVESRLTLIGAATLWFPALVGSLTPKLIQVAAQDAKDS